MHLTTSRNYKTHSITAQRLHWYRECMSEKLTRYKHGLIIIIVLFVPTLAMLGSFIAPPVLAVISPAPNSWQVLGYQVLIQIVFLSWLILQSDAVSGQPAREFINTLPLRMQSILLTDVTILAVANILLWLPILFALILAPYKMIDGMSEYLSFFLRTANLITSVVCVQLIWIYQRRFFLIYIFIADLIASTSVFYLHKPFLTNSLLFLTFTILMMIPFAILYLKPFDQLKFSRLLQINKYYQHPHNSVYFSILKLQIIILTKKYRLLTLIRSGASLILLTMGICILFLDKANLNIIIVASMILTFNTFIVTGFYQRLYEAHQAYIEYTRTLPINKYFLGMFDFQFITSIILTQSLIFIAILYFNFRVNLLSSILLFVLQIPLSLLLCFTQKVKKFGTLFSFCVTALYCVIIILLLKG